jgi:hypothetical protein
MPSIRRVADDVAGANHVDTVLICNRACSLDEDEVLAVVMLVRHRPCSCTKVNRQGVQTRKHTRAVMCNWLARCSGDPSEGAWVWFLAGLEIHV